MGVNPIILQIKKIAPSLSEKPLGAVLLASVLTTCNRGKQPAATAQEAPPAVFPSPYTSKLYQDLDQKYALIGAVTGLALGASQEALRQMKKQLDEEETKEAIALQKAKLNIVRSNR